MLSSSTTVRVTLSAAPKHAKQEHMHIVDEILARCASPRTGRAPVVVFDLDGTLFDNAPRTWQILVDFAEQHGDAKLRVALDALPRHGLPYLLKDTLALCGIDDDAFVKRARDFWFARFFTDAFQRFDEPVPGAVRFAQACFDAGATLVYLSGRDAPKMLVGCVESLRRHAFPVGVPRTAVVLKRAFEDDDLEFKRSALSFMDQLGDVVATFDNEPANCNLFQQHWPGGAHVFVHTTHAPDPPQLHAAVLRVTDLHLEAARQADAGAALTTKAGGR